MYFVDIITAMYKRFQGYFLSNSLFTVAISNGNTRNDYRTGIYAVQCQATYRGEGFKIYDKPS